MLDQEMFIRSGAGTAIIVGLSTNPLLFFSWFRNNFFTHDKFLQNTLLWLSLLPVRVIFILGPVLRVLAVTFGQDCVGRAFVFGNENVAVIQAEPSQ